MLDTFLTPERIESIIRIGTLIVVGLPIVFALSRLLTRTCQKKLSPQQTMIINKVFLYSMILIIGITIVYELGFTLAPLLGAAGIVGIAVGFASQTSVSNIISGIFLIAERPFQVNDMIKVGNTTGRVISVDLLSIKLRTVDNHFVRIPNETLIKSELTNITRFPTRRADIIVSIAYKEDINSVKELLLKIAQDHPLCLNDPEPFVLFSSFGASSIDLQFSIWAEQKNFAELKNSIQIEIKMQFDQRGIEIPYPHVSIYTGEATSPFPVKLTQNAVVNGSTKG